MSGVCAALRVPGRAETGLLLRELELLRGRGIGPAEDKGAIQWLDAIGAQQARDWLDWALTQKPVVEALQNPSHPAHRMVKAQQNLLQHFAFDRAGPDGNTPTLWQEPISSGLTLYLAGLQPRVDPSELLPNEAATVAEIASTHPDYRDSPAQLTEIQALRAHAETAAPATETLIGATAAQTPTEQSTMTKSSAERIAELNAVLRDHRLSASDRSILRDELAELLTGHPEGEALPPAAPAPALGTPKETTVTAPSGPGGLTQRSIRLTEELRGNRFFGSTERRAKVAELAEVLLDNEPGPDNAA